MGGCAEGFLQAPRAEQGCRPPQFIDFAYFVGDVDVTILADLLHDERHGEQRGEVGGANRLMCAGMQYRWQRTGEISLNVVPVTRNLGLRQVKTYLFIS